MLRDFYKALSPVRWRQRLVRSLSGLVIGATLVHSQAWVSRSRD